MGVTRRRRRRTNRTWPSSQPTYGRSQGSRSATRPAPVPPPGICTLACGPSTACTLHARCMHTAMHTACTLHAHRSEIACTLRAHSIVCSSGCRPAARRCRAGAQGGSAAGRRAHRCELRLRAAELEPAEMLCSVNCNVVFLVFYTFSDFGLIIMRLLPPSVPRAQARQPAAGSHGAF